MIPSLVFVLVLALWAVGVAAAQLRCIDAARAAARGIARGESADDSRAAARQAAPRGASVEANRSGDLVRVRVTARVRAPLPFADRLPGLSVGGEAVASTEGDGGPG